MMHTPRGSTPTAPAAQHPRAGGILIEIMVAMSMFALLLVGVAKLNLALARGVYPVSGGAAQSGIVTEQINQFVAMNFDSLAAYSGTSDTVIATGLSTSAAAITYIRKVTVTTVSASQLNVTIVITPTNSVFTPDTVKFERTKVAANPFNT